jgi:hypothetical protein
MESVAIAWDRLTAGSLHISWDVAVFVTFFAIVSGILVFLIVENRRSRFIFGLRALLEINEYFHSGAMLETRRKAAAALLNDSYDEHVEDLLDFFEMVGYLFKRGAIKKDFVWNNISYWIIRYGYAANIYREKEQQRLPRRWQNLTSLFRYLVRMERNKYGISVITNDSIKEFLKREHELLNT